MAKAERMVAHELARLGGTEADLARRRKNDPEKLAIAARLRKGDHPVAQEPRGPSAFGDFQQRECNAAFLDAGAGEKPIDSAETNQEMARNDNIFEGLILKSRRPGSSLPRRTKLEDAIKAGRRCRRLIEHRHRLARAH